MLTVYLAIALFQSFFVGRVRIPGIDNRLGSEQRIWRKLVFHTDCSATWSLYLDGWHNIIRVVDLS